MRVGPERGPSCESLTPGSASRRPGQSLRLGSMRKAPSDALLSLTRHCYIATTTLRLVVNGCANVARDIVAIKNINLVKLAWLNCPARRLCGRAPCQRSQVNSHRPRKGCDKAVFEVNPRTGDPGGTAASPAPGAKFRRRL